MKDVHDFAFLDQVVFAGRADPNQVTKAEVAVLLSIQGLQTIYYNMEHMEEVSDKTLLTVSGARALHLIRQLHKPSTDKFTEGKKKVVCHRGSYYLIRCYKFVDTDYFKLEVTKAVPDSAEALDLQTTMWGSLKLLRKVVGGAKIWLLPSYMSRKDFIPVTSIIGTL